MEHQSRDQQVTEIRPKLNLPEATSQEEQFQNDVLRPILKLQNDWLIHQVSFYIRSRHKEFPALSEAAKISLLRQASKQDPELRNIIVFGVSSMLTTEELPYYQEHRPALNKRIVQMGAERVLSQLNLIY